MSNRDIVVLSAVRSPIGAFGGSLADFESTELAGIVMKEAIARSGVDPLAINYVTVGTTMPTDSRYAYVSRVASIQAGLDGSNAGNVGVAGIGRHRGADRNVVDGQRINTGAGNRFLHDNAGEFRAFKISQGTTKSADGGTNCA